MFATLVSVLFVIAHGKSNAAISRLQNEFDLNLDELTSNYTSSIENDDNLGICYGSTTSWSSYKYVVALRTSNGAACCTGAVISLSRGIIVTAAHCTCARQVVIGCNNPSNCGTGSGIYWFNVPSGTNGFRTAPGWNSNTLKNDVAVIDLGISLSHTGATQLNIPSIFGSPSGTLRVVGYGQDQTGGVPSTLQTGTESVVSWSNCDSTMRGLGITSLDSSNICYQGGGGSSATAICSGDSGGPAVSGSTVWAVNSWVLQPCSPCTCCNIYPQVGAWLGEPQIHGFLTSEIH